MTSAALADKTRIMTVCFHGIGKPRRPLEPGEERFWIEEARYRELLEAIGRHPRQVDITFDDGNASDAEIGLPALQQLGVPARFFVITDRIGQKGSLARSQLLELAAAGMSFGTHGASHRPWPDLEARGLLDEEMRVSCGALQEVLGVPVDQAAFPRGLYNRRVLTVIRRHGIGRAYSVDEGTSRRRSWLQTRYSVISSETPESITALLDNPNRTSGLVVMRTVKRTLKKWM